MKTLVRALIAASIILVLTHISALAGIEEAGMGSRAVAMGQAQTGAANDASAATYNPAALVAARKYWGLGDDGFSMLVQIGQSGYDSRLTINGVDQNIPYVAYTTLGALVPIGKRLTFGLNMAFSNDWFLYTELATGYSFTRYKPTRQLCGGGYSFGLKITDKLSVGYASTSNLNFNFSTVNLDINSILSGIGLSLGEPATNVNPFMEIDVIPSSSYQFGALYRPFKWASLGFNYSYKNPTLTVIPILIPAGLLPETHINVNIRTERPTRMVFGVGLYPNDKLTFAVDMAYEMWSHTRNYTRIESPGSSLISPPKDPIVPEDVWVPHFGVEYCSNLRGGKLSRMKYAVRGGYYYFKSPYPAAEGTNKDVDNSAHNFSAGISLGYTPKKGKTYISLDYYWEYMDLIRRTNPDITRNPAIIVTDGYVIYSGFAFNVKI